jgi:NADPH:quinone reductase-like Zn-dependent oxidoreductase
MKAVLYTEYGKPEVLQVKEKEKPVPQDNEILVKVYASSVNYGDILARNMKEVTFKQFNMPMLFALIAKLSFGISKPKKNILGSEFAGTIEAVGKDVTRLKPGDEVYGYRAMKMGTNTEYLSIPENEIVALKPSNMSFEEASTVPYGAMTAFNLLKNVSIKKGDKVLVNGASGSIGSYALQFAKYFGAEVTGVCGTNRLDFVKSLGADNVIDYKKEDFTKNGKTYDLIFDVLGRSSFEVNKNSLKKNGRVLYASFKSKKLFQMLRTKLFSGRDDKKVICALAPASVNTLNSVTELIESGKIKTIIDKVFPMEEAAKAHRYIEEGEKKGNVILKIAGEQI